MSERELKLLIVETVEALRDLRTQDATLCRGDVLNTQRIFSVLAKWEDGGYE
jgi:hypothetical protein